MSPPTMPDYHSDLNHSDGCEDDISQVLIENSLVAAKRRAEEALSAAEGDLIRAQARIEQQRLQIATLSGRGTAHKIASEEASRTGASWNISDVKRFSLLPQGPADFVNDALREMLDQALVGVDRRVREAVAQGAKARSEADRAEGEGEANLEAAYSKCKEPAAEHAVRQASRALFIKSGRCLKNLRVACKRLEEEAAAAQATHAADMRSMGARLVAQRDAITHTLLDELQKAEFDGAVSIRGLHETIGQLRGDVESRDAELAELRELLVDTQGRLKDEKIARQREYERFTKEVKTLKGEVSRLGDKLQWTERDFAVGNLAISAELARTESELAEEAQACANAMSQTTGEANAAVRLAEERLKALRIEARQMHHNMSASYRELEEAKMEQEQEHTAMLLLRENEVAKERAFLRSKIDSLGKQVMHLRSSSSRGRAMLYWSSMKNKGSDMEVFEGMEGYSHEDHAGDDQAGEPYVEYTKPSLKQVFDAAWQQANPKRSPSPLSKSLRRSASRSP